MYCTVVMYISIDMDDNSLDNESITDDDENHCMVCLESSTDSAPLITSSSFFVSDCKCKYLAHEECMTEWVMKQINNKKQLLCPYCNLNVTLTVDYGLLFESQDVCLEIAMVTSPPQSRTQKICHVISGTDKCSTICRCFFCVFFLMLIVFVYILM